MVEPSQITIKLASSPAINSSMIIFVPALPYIFSLSIKSTASCASSSVIATTTPFPDASPSALITMGAGLFFMYSCAEMVSSKVENFAVGIL